MAYLVHLGWASLDRPSSWKFVSWRIVTRIEEYVLCGPRATAAARYVGKVGDDEGSIVRSFALEAYALPS
jgi:hypothetical protein